jgi:uncharacterized protein YecE (DUF72 family)
LNPSTQQHYTCFVKIHVGTSGFSYKEWKGKFYPDRISPKEMLSFYSRRFDTVEINNTFYRMPKEDLLLGWARQVPDGFIFALKASQVITHIKRLRNVEADTTHLMETVAVLGEKLGPVLFQLPASFAKDHGRLKGLLDLLPRATVAFEFRHPSWFTDEVFDLLRERQCALCVSDAEPDPPPEVIKTAGWGYLRLRRPGYVDEDLVRWQERIAAQGWDEAYLFFKHEDEAAGPALAERFRTLGEGTSQEAVLP